MLAVRQQRRPGTDKKKKSILDLFLLWYIAQKRVRQPFFCVSCSGKSYFYSVCVLCEMCLQRKWPWSLTSEGRIKQCGAINLWPFRINLSHKKSSKLKLSKCGNCKRQLGWDIAHFYNSPWNQQSKNVMWSEFIHSRVKAPLSGGKTQKAKGKAKCNPFCGSVLRVGADGILRAGHLQLLHSAA